LSRPPRPDQARRGEATRSAPEITPVRQTTTSSKDATSRLRAR
jgi:hypothetical protein